MSSHPERKYRPFVTPIELADRRWPSRRLERAPRWLSTDLRDGNQALADPMDGEKKLRFWDLLLKIGFREIEVAFPSASQTDFDFVRRLIEEERIPEDVAVQVLTPARPELVARTFDSLEGARQATVHLYNATAPLFRRVVFGMDEKEIIALTTRAARTIRDEGDRRPGTRWTYEYSPETFCFTEPEFALEVCERVLDVWQPTPDHPVILNLPGTVEVATPNVYADQIEWFCRHLSRRDAVVISLHPHNDRGTAVAAAELALMAGADRVEGCLFGNGERTGNVDLVTLALNLHTQGIDPGLDFSAMREVVETVSRCNGLPVHPRHPYAGELVFTAFSGSHQDAIKKGFEAHARRNDGLWEMPYLPIDPADLGESYEAVIRVNGQSGKGGFAWVLARDHGLELPRALQVNFATHVQRLADETGRELTGDDVWRAFRTAYRLDGDQPIELIAWEQTGLRRPPAERGFSGRVTIAGSEVAVSGRGNGLVSATLDALASNGGVALDVVDWREHAIGRGADARAVAYVEAVTPAGARVFGVGIDTDIATASVRAVVSATNGALGAG